MTVLERQQHVSGQNSPRRQQLRQQHVSTPRKCWGQTSAATSAARQQALLTSTCVPKGHTSAAPRHQTQQLNERKTP